jgi:competence protein ComFB
VTREYERLVKSFPGFCGCETCRDDVVVFALNRIPPHYVTHRRGAVLQHIKMQRDQEVADISVALLEGFRRVQKAPRPDHLGPAAARSKR